MIIINFSYYQSSKHFEFHSLNQNFYISWFLDEDHANKRQINPQHQAGGHIKCTQL